MGGMGQGSGLEPQGPEMRFWGSPELCWAAGPQASPFLFQASERKSSTAANGDLPSAPCSPKGPFQGAGQRLWKNLRSLPQTSRRMKQLLTSHLSATNVLGDARRVAQRRCSPVARASSWDGTCHSPDSCAATSLQNKADLQAWRGREATFRASSPASERDVASGVKAWRGKVLRALSAQVTKPEPVDLPGAQGWLPEEYLPPPPFAPGY